MIQQHKPIGSTIPLQCYKFSFINYNLPCTILINGSDDPTYLAESQGIQHDLNEYPIVQILARATFGHGLYGMSEGLYQVACVPEHNDKNNIKIHIFEDFSGIPTITKVSTREYNVSFTLETEDITIILR